MVTKVLVFLVAALAVAAVRSSAMSCVDESGSNTDWWVMLKLPTITGSSDGTQYVYADSSTTGSSFKIVTAHDITSSSSAIGRTLNNIYSRAKSTTSTGWVMYNDELPSGTVYSSGGHSKGVVGFDSTTKTGFWLIHSTPRFPDVANTGSYTWNSDENIYAQSYLCVTYAIDQLDAVGTQLSYNQVHIYDSNMPSALASVMPNMAQAISGYKISTATSSTKQLVSSGGHKFVSFAKTQQWNQDLYNSLVELYIQDSMWIETWMRPYQANCCKPTCKYDSVNVDTLQLGTVQYKETNDHSKWAISQTTGSNWVCIGDINRNTSQWGRGGGTVCFQNAAIATMFFNVIKSVDSC